ncbi:MAG: POLO box duplicated region [Cyanobacteriota bacterium]|nr:POLO box duplicated region [Cyanobacteriota bacterium]
MASALLASILTTLLTLLPARAGEWPAWSLPGPLPQPGRADLVYPSWFEGRWLVNSSGVNHEARFRPGVGGVVGERAFNALAIGRALLGESLLSVDDDPANPNRQIARLAGGLMLESTVLGRRTEGSGSDFWADELALQVLHGPGNPRVSRVETLSHYQLRPDGRIEAQQWQARYPSPALGVAARPTGTSREELSLQRWPGIPPDEADRPTPP